MRGWIAFGIAVALLVACAIFFGDVMWHMTFRG